MSEWAIEWVSKWVSEWGVSEWAIKWVNMWVIEWAIEWMSERGTEGNLKSIQSYKVSLRINYYYLTNN